MNESNDVSDLAYLLAFIFEDEDSVKEGLLLCKPLLGHIASKNIFKKSCMTLLLRISKVLQGTITSKPKSQLHCTTMYQIFKTPISFLK